MIRLALRQFRAEAIIGFGLLAALAILLAVTGPHLVQMNDAFQRACKAAGGCAAASNPVLEDDVLLRGAALPFIVTVAPALIGIFFGAPLIARELETGTFRLAWTQSVTLRRWLAVKLGLIGLAAMAIGGLLTWMVDWWMRPVDAALNQNLFDPATFSVHGVAPIGYAAFAFALGVTAGVLLRRVVPAMAATLAGFVVARLAVEYGVRPNLASPLHKTLPVSLSVNGSTGTSSLMSQVSIPNAWVRSTEVLDKSGHAVSAQSLLHSCAASALPNPAAVHACVHKLHAVVAYQPASRFWPFQWAEMSIFLVAALALCGFTYWWLQHRHG
jgi:hypothetical protein